MNLVRSLAAAVLIATAARADPARVVIGSKNFSENRLLAEMFAQLLEEQTSLEVERRLGLAGTQVCFEAVRTGAIDVYPEYTGTGLVTVLHEEPGGDAAWTWNRVSAEFRSRWNLYWIGPLGFENTFALAVPRRIAAQYSLQSISDLTAVASGLTAGFGHEFAERDDGLPGLERVYALRFGSVRTMQHALKYQAAGEGKLDCLDVYSTDGRLVVHDLVVLEDDRNFFPPYEAAALVHGPALARHPELGVVLASLVRAFDADAMRRLNVRVEEEREAIEDVARAALVERGFVSASASPARATAGKRSLWRTLWEDRGDIGQRTLEHLALSGAGLLLGIVVAVPLGLLLERRRSFAEPLIRVVGTSQTIPSLALLAFMVPFLGIGALPAVVALWIYAVFPILRNTYTGLRDAAPQAVQAATALGMTPAQVLVQVRLPLAAPILMAGVRTAAVLTVGTATLAAFIGAGGLGEPIVSGVQSVDAALILSGALPAAALAIAVDVILGLVERRLRPRGV